MSGTADAFGSSPRWEKDPPFTSRFQTQFRTTDEPWPCILLIEDNPADVFLVRQALQEQGVRADVYVATDGEQALSFIEHVETRRLPHPDLVILDLNLPKRTGQEVLTRIRDSTSLSGVTVVILSSSDTRADRETAAQHGVLHYIRKPGDLAGFGALGVTLRETLSGLASN